jgi:cytochrome c oxidase assembly factor CtaG
MHTLEHASFFGTALLFWRGTIGARSARETAPALGGAFFTLLHSGMLGAVITLAPRPLYGWYGGTQLWGLTAIEDQQLAGLLMWVPMGVVYFGACLLLAGRLLALQTVTDGTHLPRPSAAILSVPRCSGETGALHAPVMVMRLLYAPQEFDDHQ